MTSNANHVACSNCFSDEGLRLDAEKFGAEVSIACSNCGKTDGRKLTKEELSDIAYRFFVWGSFHKTPYGGYPKIQFNDRQKTSIHPSSWLVSDIKTFETILGVGFFPYGPRFWMFGEVEPLKALQNATTQKDVIKRVLTEYPSQIIGHDKQLYRIRKDPYPCDNVVQFDSPPEEFLGKGRLDTPQLPVLYCSPDIGVCVHECRFTAEDDLYVATLTAQKPLRILDLTHLLIEEKVTEFESLDMAVHMLFLAGRHAFPITQAISTAAHTAGFDGIIYPSYFSLLRSGWMPLQTVYGISHRRIPNFQKLEEAKGIPNLAIFGRPIAEGKLTVRCLNRLMMTRVDYNFVFGPVSS